MLGYKFSPVVDQLLEMIFCPRDEDTGLFHRACSFGECKKCGWSKHFGGFEVLDRAGVMITWDTYELCFKGTEAERNKREEAGLKNSKRQTRVRKAAVPSDFILIFENILMEYARHHFIAVWQAYRRKIVVQNLPKDFMTTEWDFAENYTMIHNNAIQSEYWNQSQLTLLVSLTHYWDPKDQDNILTDVHIYLSGDRKHDTSFVQLAMTHHGKLYSGKLNAARVKHNLCKIRRHLVNLDGAASHFKNKYTFKYMMLYSKKVFPGMEWVAWETCAPSHVKGPHDGLGAVIKTLL
jgi:hypothetical protein